MIKKLIIFLAVLSSSLSINAQTISVISTGKATSIRGLSVVNDKTAWVSGSKGFVGITTDAGTTWAWQQVKGYEKSDFRDIEAFSDKEAVIMSSGSPAMIMKTIDGGANWKVNYQQTDSTYFLDAMDFGDDKHGFILGDPIGGKLLLLETKNGGDNWAPVVNAPIALPNEAAFAASGTCLRVSKTTIMIATGGGKSRLLMSPVEDMVWVDRELPLTNGVPSRGAFSVAYNNHQTVIVGGNYAKDKITDSVAYIISNTKFTPLNYIPKVGPTGFQSCVEYLRGETFLSTGTPGSNITIDGGRTWKQIDTTSFNVCRKAKRGNLILFAGDRGKLGIYKP
jgi:photosystem II stability/assembly factor-like uncharacterized protein